VSLKNFYWDSHCKKEVIAEMLVMSGDEELVFVGIIRLFAQSRAIL